MPLPTNFVESLKLIHTRELLEMLHNKQWPVGNAIVEIVNEISPADLFCYLGGRFGQPNGIQNFLREEDSDNLIHWEWTLRHKCGLVSFSGMNFRTEVHFQGDFKLGDDDKEELIRQIKSDFISHGQQMGNVRCALEDWIEFVNPYQRIKRSIDRLVEKLDDLNLQPDYERLDGAWETKNADDSVRQWNEAASRYSKGFGLCFGIRSMLPVLAEAYVNLVIFILMRPEYREDQRLRDNIFRQPIDVRIKSLSINCIGFERQLDYSNDVCKRYHTLVNERNDLLHGNVVIDKLKFNEVYFLGKIPIFKEYRSMWQRSLEVEMKAVGLRNVRDEIAVVDGFVAYVQSCLCEDVRIQVEPIIESYELGLNKATQRIGILFPPWLVDMRVRVPTPNAETDDGPQTNMDEDALGGTDS